MTEYRRGRGPHFAPIPFELLEDPEIDAYAIATYAVLKSYADFGSSGGARPSDAQAAKLAGCGDRTFRARRELLCEKGWVEWETRAGRTNLYVVHSSPEPDTSAPRAEVEAADLGTTCRPPRHHMPTTSAPHADDLEPCTENQVPTIPHTPLERPPSVAAATKRGEDYSDAFEEAWTAYPKREGGNSKRRAWRAWRARLRGGASTTDLTAGVTRYAGWIRATGKEHTPYIMQTATFFGPDEHWAEPWEIPPEASNGHPADDLPVPIEVVKDFLDTGGTFLSVAATRPEAFERIKAAYPDAWPRAEPYFRRLPFGRLMELKRSRDRFGLDAAIRDQLRSMAHDN